MPGIRELLDTLQQRDDVFLALLTGKLRAGARIKLEHFDLWRYFRCGAFGDDAADRNALVPFALERARRCGLPDLAPETSSWSATRRTMSRAHMPSAPCPSAWRRVVHERSAARQRRRQSCSEDLGRPAGFLQLLDE